MAFYSSTELRILPNYDINVRSINHRGYNITAPENTIPAFQLSKHIGFDYVETDVAFTSDNVPVLLHDATINRTSNGTGNISQLTFQQVRQYDFGSWKNSKYAGTKIPSLDEFLSICKRLMLKPYIELKSNETYTEAQIQLAVDIVNKYDMSEQCTFISFNQNYLTYVKNYAPNIRLGLLRGSYITNDENICNSLKTEHNNVFYDLDYNNLTDEVLTIFKNNKIPIELWTVDSSEIIETMDGYISGVTSDNLIAGKILYDNTVDVI